MKIIRSSSNNTSNSSSGDSGSRLWLHVVSLGSISLNFYLRTRLYCMGRKVTPIRLLFIYVRDSINLSLALKLSPTLPLLDHPGV